MIFFVRTRSAGKLLTVLTRSANIYLRIHRYPVESGWLTRTLIAITVCHLYLTSPQLQPLKQNAGNNLSDGESDMDEFQQPPLSPNCTQRSTRPPIYEPTLHSPTMLNGDIPPVCDLNGLSKYEHPVLPTRIPGGENLLQRIRHDQYADCRTDNIHYPFRSRGEWQLAQWLTNSSLTQAQIDSFLKLEEVKQLYYCVITPH